MNAILMALLAWLFAASAGSAVSAPSAATPSPTVVDAVVQPSEPPPAHPSVVVAATPPLGMRVGDYPYIYVQFYCDGYIYCQEAPGVPLSQLGPLLHPPNLRPDLKDTFWVTVEAYQKYLAAQTPPPPDPIEP